MDDEKKILKHPSFGVVKIARVSVGGTRGMSLFNSPLKHHHIVELKICGAELHRQINRDYAFPGESKISVYMSESQFGRMVASAGIGEGVPCTIEYFDGKRVEDLPEAEGVKRVFDKEIKDLTKKVAVDIYDAVKMVKTLLEQPRVTKGELNKLKSLMERAEQNITSNIPYVEHSFEEALEKAVDYAKTEIEAHAVSVLQRTGLDRVAGVGGGEKIVMLSDGSDKKE